MANDDLPRGLVPLNTNNGGTVQTNVYEADTANDVYIGMPVALNAAGQATAAAVGVDLTCILGVATGFLDETAGAAPNKDLNSPPFLDVSDFTSVGNPHIIVSDDPNQEYYIQEDTGSTALTQAAAGTTAHLLFQATSGNTTTGWTTAELDASTAASDTGGSFQLLRFHRNMNSDGSVNAAGDYAKWVVKIYHHQRAGKSQPTAI